MLPCVHPMYRDELGCKMLLTSFIVKEGILSVNEMLNKGKSMGRGILHMAAQRGSLKCLKYLIDNHGDLLHVNEKDTSGNIPPHCAAFGNQFQQVEVSEHVVLQKAQCQVQGTCSHGSVVELLVNDLHANMWLENTEKLTPVACSVKYGHTQVLKTFIELGIHNEK